MKNVKFHKLLIPFILILISCGKSTSENEEKNQPDEEAKKQEKIDSLQRLKVLDKISKEFDASASFDTSRYMMTYEYQNLLNENQRVIIENFRIKDIEKIQDSLYNISLTTGYRRRMFIEFICSKSQIENFYPKFLDSNFDYSNFNNPFLILKLNSIKKIKLKLDSNDDDESSSYIELNASKSFICKGEFVGFFPNTKN
jgi:hypothetical protein